MTANLIIRRGQAYLTLDDLGLPIWTTDKEMAERYRHDSLPEFVPFGARWAGICEAPRPGDTHWIDCDGPDRTRIVARVEVL